IRIHASPALRLSDHDIADLDDWRKIRVVRNISHDLLGMWAKAGLERLDRVTEDVTHGDIGRGRARGAAGNTFVDRVELAGIAQARLDQRHVLVFVIGMVEPGAWRVRIHDTDLDHGVLSWLSFRWLKVKSHPSLHAL